MKQLILSGAGVLLAVGLVSAGQSAAAPEIDKLFASFWAAETVSKASRAVDPIVAATPPFDQVYARLEAGRSFKPQQPGVHGMETLINGALLENTVDVPAEYDPAKRWPLRVQLHGGVGRMPGQRNAPGRQTAGNRIPGEPQLVLQPRAYATSQWWERNQAQNVVDLVDRIKRTYNVDESRIYITGISDGGTGTYFFAMRSATLWSACLPLNGHPSVLANPEVGADGEMFLGNLANCPLYLVNGGKDPLYPAASVAPFVESMKRASVPVSFTVYPEAGHDTSWWPQERAKFEAFLAAHPRAAHPPRISWETDRTDRYNRFRWLSIDRLGARPSDAMLEDVNDFSLPSGRKITLYARSGRSGRVDVQRQGNSFEAKTRGVQQFTLLLSPAVIDFSKPVTVAVNGRQAFNAVVTRDVATLLKWAARDNDRTMLYGAEIRINVP